MRVADQQRQAKWHALEFPGQPQPQRPDARARVQHHQLAVGPHLDARRVAPEEQRRGPRRGD